MLLKLESYYALIDDVVHVQRIHDHILGRESEVNSGLTSIFNMNFQPCLHYGEEIQKYEGTGISCRKPLTSSETPS